VAGRQFQGYLDSTLMSIFILGVVLVLGDAAVRVWKTLHGEPIPEEAFGVEVQTDVVKMRCC
jgi:hypothetical protein